MGASRYSWIRAPAKAGICRGLTCRDKIIAAWQSWRHAPASACAACKSRARPAGRVGSRPAAERTRPTGRNGAARRDARLWIDPGPCAGFAFHAHAGILAALEPWDDTPLTEPVEQLYLASAAQIFGLLRGVAETVHSVLLVGHNPGLHELAARLATGGGEPARRLAAKFRLPRSPNSPCPVRGGSCGRGPSV